MQKPKYILRIFPLHGEFFDILFYEEQQSELALENNWLCDQTYWLLSPVSQSRG
tara:strand:- start:322 stop:483 length:162 start_codon:yes stop_codon:yes gene_type:complete